tara:strand:+ start:1420 stop:1554 length:135 start_codon:yes stop_codon:yes gene_type:complete
VTYNIVIGVIIGILILIIWALIGMQIFDYLKILKYKTIGIKELN